MSRRTARRQRFYAQQRDLRLFRRVARLVTPDGWHEAYEEAFTRARLTGTGIVTLWDRGDGEGFTAKCIEPDEFPRAMLRSVPVDISPNGPTI